MIGPSGPMQSPDGTEATMPIVLANIVCQLVKDVDFPVIGECPPLGWTPFKKAISPGIPDDAAAGSIRTHMHAMRQSTRLEPVHESQARPRSPAASRSLAA
jgi:hypothetical protein